MDESDLRGLASADDLAQICAVTLAALDDRERGREVLNFNSVDVVLDLDENTVLFQDILGTDTPDVHMSIEGFKEVATRFAGPQEVAVALERRRQREAQRRVWPMPTSGE